MASRSAGERPTLAASRSHTLDVSLLAEVRAFAARWEGPLHAIVHNAGVMPPERGETSEGHELTLATHVLGPHLLTKRLPARPLDLGLLGRHVRPEARHRRPRVPQGRVQARDGVRADQTHAGRARRGVGQARPGSPSARTRAGSTRRASPTRCRPSRSSRARSCARPSRARTRSCGWSRRRAGAPPGQFLHDRALRPEHYLPSTRESEQDRRTFWDAVEALSEASA